MYLEYYGFKEFPFQMTPDHRFFFESGTHRRALANLVFGMEQGEGFIVITGEVGSGKTTLLDHLLATLDPNDYLTGKVVSTHLAADDMLRAVAAAFRLPYQSLDKASLLDLIENFLLSSRAKGKRILLLVDEAQNIPPPALEELRMLSNFQFDNKVPLQCVLLGQPQFARVLVSPDLEQFRQRIIASYHLNALNPDEMGDYIRHRLSVAGWKDDPRYEDGVFAEIFRVTRGIPRKINWFCGRVLLHAFLDDSHVIDVDMVKRVEAEALEESRVIEATVPASSGVMHEKPVSVPVNGAGSGLAALDQRLERLEKLVQRQGRALSFLTSQFGDRLEAEEEQK
jgi:putative secretion ATPase (PEP-CTERM system associated)